MKFKILETIRNLNIKDGLSIEEKNTKIEKESGALFQEIESYLLNNEIFVEDKIEVITLLFEFIDAYPLIQNKIKDVPISIRYLYRDYVNLKGINVLFEIVNSYEFPANNDFEDLVTRYLNFLNDTNTELFIQYCSAYIRKFNNQLKNYLNREYLGETFEKSFNQDLINDLKQQFKNFEEDNGLNL